MQYDMLIVGGGLVGGSLALALQDTGMHIALIDARLPTHDDPRLFGLNDSSCQLLKNIHVWSELKNHASPIQEVHVSHRGHFGAVKLKSEEAYLPSLGHVVPAKNIEKLFNERIKAMTHVTVYQPATFKKLIQDNHHAFVTIQSEHRLQTLQAPLVIAADGTDSSIRAQLNLPTKMLDYQQSAIVTRITLQRFHQHIAHERFIRNGTIAMLPLLGNECVCIWSAKENSILELMQLNDQDFLAQLQTQFGYRLGKFLKIQKRFVFPLRMVKTDTRACGAVFLLGNAAHTLHPIAAQGFNLALYEIAVFVDSIKKQLKMGKAFTAADLLQVHQQTEPQCQRSYQLSHRLAEIFAKQSVLINILLPLGMVGLDIATPLKLKFIKGMMGRVNPVPRLLLSEEFYNA